MTTRNTSNLRGPRAGAGITQAEGESISQDKKRDRGNKWGEKNQRSVGDREPVHLICANRFIMPPVP